LLGAARPRQARTIIVSLVCETVTTPTISETIDAMRRSLAPAAVGALSFRIEPAAEAGGTVALIHVYGAYDCKGTEAEVAGLLKDAALPWRIVWH
jgi:hypothetical protein